MVTARVTAEGSRKLDWEKSLWQQVRKWVLLGLAVRLHHGLWLWRLPSRLQQWSGGSSVFAWSCHGTGWTAEVVRLVWVNWGHSSGEQEARKCLASACSPGWVSCITWVPLAHYGRWMEAKRSCSGAARSQLEAGTGLGSPALILLCSPLEVEVRAVQYLLWSSSLQSGHDTRMKCKQKPVAANKTSLRPWWRLMGPPWKWELEFGADLPNHEVLACTGVISMFIHDLNSAHFKNKQ